VSLALKGAEVGHMRVALNDDSVSSEVASRFDRIIPHFSWASKSIS